MIDGTVAFVAAVMVIITAVIEKLPALADLDGILERVKIIDLRPLQRLVQLGESPKPVPVGTKRPVHPTSYASGEQCIAGWARCFIVPTFTGVPSKRIDLLN
jgi:hypothetical protein